jgi:hypothetical protein
VGDEGRDLEQAAEKVASYGRIPLATEVGLCLPRISNGGLLTVTIK